MIIARIQGVDITLTTDEQGREVVDFIADADVDCDGSGGNPYHDPYFQSDTKLHYNGKPLHAEVEAYVVVPPAIIQHTKGIVLGSLCELTNLSNNLTCRAVVGDEGPRSKIGELSPKACVGLGLDPNPNHGGTDLHIIRYKIHVGRPAVLDGITYQLQKA